MAVDSGSESTGRSVHPSDPSGCAEQAPSWAYPAGARRIVSWHSTQTADSTHASSPYTGDGGPSHTGAQHGWHHGAAAAATDCMAFDSREIAGRALAVGEKCCCNFRVACRKLQHGARPVPSCIVCCTVTACCAPAACCDCLPSQPKRPEATSYHGDSRRGSTRRVRSSAQPAHSAAASVHAAWCALHGTPAQSLARKAGLEPFAPTSRVLSVARCTCRAGSWAHERCMVFCVVWCMHECKAGTAPARASPRPPPMCSR